MRTIERRQSCALRYDRWLAVVWGPRAKPSTKPGLSQVAALERYVNEHKAATEKASVDRQVLETRLASYKADMVRLRNRHLWSPRCVSRTVVCGGFLCVGGCAFGCGCVCDCACGRACGCRCGCVRDTNRRRLRGN